MSKEIKDYLHLYLGAECLANVPNIEVKQRLIIDGDLIGYEGENYFTNIQPLLRKLSDMTGKERSLYLSYWDNVEVFSSSRVEAATKRDAEATRYLLFKHFDLFNLIPEGLAIDKNKLK